MTRTILTAALLLISGVARAEPAWYDAAVANWNEGIQRTDVIDWVKFKDETGVDRTLYIQKSKVPYAKDEQVIALDLPLFELQAPRVEKRTMRVPVQLFPEKVEETTVDLVIFEKSKVSIYYVKGVDNFHYIIGRRDRPDTAFKNTWIAGNWDLNAGWIERKENMNGLVFYGRVQLYKPEGISPAAVTPLTADVENNSCRGIADHWLKPNPGAWAQIYRGWLPQEFEFWEVPLAPALSTPGIWTPLYKEAEKQISENGSFEKAAQYHDWFRAAAAPAVDAAIKALGSGPADHLTPGESRFVLCRMRHLGPDAEKQFLSQANAASSADKAAKFTSFWRSFMKQELDQYRLEIRIVPRLPRLPDHAASETALAQRTNNALAGKLLAPAAPPAAAPPARPKPGLGDGAAQRKIDDLLGRMR